MTTELRVLPRDCKFNKSELPYRARCVSFSWGVVFSRSLVQGFPLDGEWRWTTDRRYASPFSL